MLGELAAGRPPRRAQVARALAETATVCASLPRSGNGLMQAEFLSSGSVSRSVAAEVLAGVLGA